MNFVKVVKKIFWYPISSPSKIEIYQEKIRKIEWDAIKEFIPTTASFLDVGCGAGFSMIKAQEELACFVQGIDPEPGAHGVGRFTENLWKERPIVQGNAENLPYPDASFDVVYSSHVLEHVASENKALEEMKRVLKPEGILIIGVPTSTMSLVALISSWLFTTHISLYEMILNSKSRSVFNRFVRIFIPNSHSSPRAKYILYDIQHYRISRWKKTVSNHFDVKKVITPGLYPYPDYIQWFPYFRFGKISSSVFFICKLPKI